MKFWQGFILLWICFFLFVIFGPFSENDNPLTGYVPFTGVLKEDPNLQIVSPDLNVTFEFGEGPFYRLWDVNYIFTFEKDSRFDIFVDLDYFVFDSDNEIVYYDEERILLEEDMILEGDLDTRRAHEIELQEGEYTFLSKVSYSESEFDFSQKFEIKKLSDVFYSLSQLFDIRMELYTSSFYDLDNFGATVLFENFGSEPTPVNLTFFIYDEFDNEVYRKDRSLIVETEEVVFEDFEDLQINPGKYTLVLRTLYNVDIEDYFEQDFEYLKKQNYWFLVVIAVVVVLGLFFLFRERTRKR